MSRAIYTGIAVLALGASGVVHGLWTDRWSPGEDLRAAAARLEQLPDQLSEWQGGAIERHDGSKTNLAGAVTRVYENRATGRTVTVYLACGRGGPASIHTPDICYPASGFALERHVAHHLTLPGRSERVPLLTADLRKRRAGEGIGLRAFWTWHAAGNWAVTDSPGSVFARQPVLYKLYFVRELGETAEPVAEDDCLDLAALLVPRLEVSVFCAGRER